MQIDQPQHSKQRVIEVANQSLIYQSVTVHDNSITGTQIATAVGFTDQVPVVLQVLQNGSLEEIRPDEIVNLDVENSRFIVVESDRTYFFTIDGARMEWPCRHITGHVIRKLGCIDEYKKLLIERGNEADIEIKDDEFIDLDKPGIERFVSRKETWKLNVQGKVFVFETPIITIREAIVRAGLNPNQPWHIHFIVAGKPKEEKNIDDAIDLRMPGIEKLRLTPKNVINGEERKTIRHEFNLLPTDESYLNEMEYCWETCLNGSSRWLLIHNYTLPMGYNHQQVKLALLITSGYPKNKLDMFYVFPSLMLTNGSRIPATEGTGLVDGVTYQRWSRHRAWNPETDSVISQLAMVDGCLLKEVEQ